LGEVDAVGAPAHWEAGKGLGAWLYEPDRAVIRAGLTGALAHLVDGRELDAGVGYVTSDHVAEVAWAHRYAVIEALPWNLKAVRALLRDHRIGRLTIKKRGVSLEPDAVRRQLRLRGEEEGTLVLTRVAGQAYGILVRPS